MEDKLKFIEELIILAKKHKVDVLKAEGVELVITRHDISDGAVEGSNDDTIKIEGVPMTEEEILYYSGDDEG